MKAKRLSMAIALAALGSVLGVATMGVAAAGALEPGVHVDPGSPAAKEYALPLSQARQTGAGPASSPGASEPSFGAGIKPPRSGGPGGPGTHGSAGTAGGGRRTSAGSPTRRRTSASSSDHAAAATPPLPPAVRRAVAAADSSGGGGSLPALIGGGVAILVLGGFGGTVLRHSRRPTPSG
jgi:hypothetical protein